ncbi:hypothetical protein L210DRAFT_2012305 [Boletus edulis BED1]|uniref:Uncharacterized protein n=1 Tax=Boletus edulis BED1 TaxID=1328754 RepID=A0AAD4C9H4_BOLED|nr:hypothetical protein L210DRAFT_2012305 [Boletus edulis BED1]
MCVGLSLFLFRTRYSRCDVFGVMYLCCTHCRSASQVLPSTVDQSGRHGRLCQPLHRFSRAASHRPLSYSCSLNSNA